MTTQSKYGRGGFRGFRGRGRGSRGAYYAGNRPSAQRPYYYAHSEGYRTTQADPATSLEAAQSSVPVPADSLQHGDAYHSQGHGPSPQHSHTSSHSHPHSHSYSHPTQTTPSRHLRPPNHSHPNTQSHSHAHAEHARDREPPHLSPSQSLARPYERAEYPNDKWHCVPTWEQARPAAGGVGADAPAGDGYRAHSSFDGAVSPTQSDEQPRWLFTPSDGGGDDQQQHRRHDHSGGGYNHHHGGQNQSLSLSRRSRSASWGSSASAGRRGYARNGHVADDARRGRR